MSNGQTEQLGKLAWLIILLLISKVIIQIMRVHTLAFDTFVLNTKAISIMQQEFSSKFVTLSAAWGSTVVSSVRRSNMLRKYTGEWHYIYTETVYKCNLLFSES